MLKSERNLALQKLKLRRSDTHNKIELGTLVVKSNMHQFSKTIILGALIDAFEKMNTNNELQKLFQSKGESLLIPNSH